MATNIRKFGKTLLHLLEEIIHMYISINRHVFQDMNICIVRISFFNSNICSLIFLIFLLVFVQLEILVIVSNSYSWLINFWAALAIEGYHNITK